MVQTSQIGRRLARKRARKALEDSVLTMTAPNVPRPKTGAELVQQLLESGAIGAWADRQDIGDSSAYARELRRQAEARERG